MGDRDDKAGLWILQGRIIVMNAKGIKVEV